MAEVVDLERWSAALGKLRQAVLEIKAGRVPAWVPSDHWGWARREYEFSLSAYSAMTPEQQRQVKRPLDEVRAELEQLAHGVR